MKQLLTDLFNPNNSFFQLAKNSKRLTHISLSSFILPLVFLAIAGALTQFVLAPIILGDRSQWPTWIRQVFGLYFMFGTGIIVIFLWVKFFEGRSIVSLGFVKTQALKKYMTGFLTGVLMNSAVIGIISLLGGIELAENSQNITGIDSLYIVLIFLTGFIIQGASEEILSRGWMMQTIGARYKPWLGVLISTIIFSVLHLGNAGIDPFSVFNLILFSLFMAFLVLKDGSLWSACAWHSSWNWMLGNFYGLSVSGTGEKVSVFDLNSVGNELISGGGFGPEGSIITTIILLIGIIVLAKIIVSKSRVATAAEIN